MSTKIPLDRSPNFVGFDVDRDSVEDADVSYEYIKEAVFDQYKVNYLPTPTNVDGTVLLEQENPGSGSWLSSLFSFGSSGGKSYYVAVDGFDDFKTLPCNLNNASENQQNFDRGLLEQFTVFTAPADLADLSPGDRVRVDYALGVNNTRQNYGFITQKLSGKMPLPQSQEQCDRLRNRFEQQDAQGNARSLGSGDTSNHVMSDLVAAAPDVGANQVIEGTPLANIGAPVEDELSFWQGNVETDANVNQRLTTYWNNVGVYAGWTPSRSPWSAVFISYVIQQVDPNFAGSIAHWQYAYYASQGRGGWTMWDLSRGNIRAQEGDILIRRRSGRLFNDTPYGERITNTHGDVVYEIQGNRAILAGGNLGDTARVASRLNLSIDGFYQDTGEYEIVLKKNGRVSNYSGRVS